MFWERALLILLVALCLRLAWLNVALAAYIARSPLSYLYEGVLGLGLWLACRFPRARLTWLSLTLGWGAMLCMGLGGYLADESGGGANTWPELLLGIFALLTLGASTLKK